MGKTLGRTRVQRVLLRVALYGGALVVGIPFVMSHVLTRTPGGGVSGPPARGYEEVTLRSEGLRLHAWLSRGEPDRAAVIIVHGLGDRLESYQEHAQPLIARGHTVLLLDLRGHGASEGRHTTLGGRESEDVRSAMRALREDGLAADGIVLMGHSMGAVAVLLAGAKEEDVRAVIVEAPFDTYRNTVTHHARLFSPVPFFTPLVPLTIWVAECRADFDADNIDAVAAARLLDAPLLAIVDGADERMPESVVRRIVEAHRGPNELWIADGVGHVGAIYHADWEKVVLGFLEAHGI